VLTFKEGLLSPLAHDLDIRVTKFSIDLDADRCVAEFDTTSLVVETAMKSGAPHDGLNDDHKETIQKQIQEDVLHAGKFPVARFESTRVAGDVVEGSLTLHGETKPITVSVSQNGERLGRVTLHQPDFGITPYKAAMGTLKVKADVVIEVTLT
jgi:polyisoprenoid-binding protein YceI